MKRTYQISFNLFSVFFISIILLACMRRDNPVIQADNWQTIYQNTDLDLFSIRFLNASKGYVLAGLSSEHTSPNWELILTTSDSGNHWSADTCKFPTIDDSSGDIFPLEDGVLLSIGSHVYRSDDNGKIWVDLTPNFVYGARINYLYIIDSLNWLIAQGVSILRTNDAGHSWQIVFKTDLMGSFDKLSFPSKEVGYANVGIINFDGPGSVGQIVKTVDGGHTWAVLNAEPWKSGGIYIPFIYALQFISDQVGYLSTYGEYKLYKSTDGGDNWLVMHKNNNTTGLEFFVSEKLGYYSDGETIFVTNDSGKSWNVDYFNNAPNSDILTWTFIGNGQGYAITRDHRIIKRIN
jgi:photosystem II stability/assembly factor-like uncharacterized protein